MTKNGKWWLALAIVTAACWATLVVSRHGLLYWVSNTTDPEPPSDAPGAAYGVIPTFRCHYFTGSGTVTTDTSMAFGADPCHVIISTRS